MTEKEKGRGLSPADILTRVDAKVQDCVAFADTRLAKEVERVLKYYNSQLPARQSEGSSSYVTTDVYDAVESMKAQLLETFAGSDEIVKFPPQGDDDIEKARIATAYCSYVIHRENDGYAVFRDAIHDGLTARVGVTKVFWEEKTEYIEETFEGLSYDDVQGLAAQEDVEELDAEADDQGIFAGTLSRAVDRSKVTLLSIPPEEFVISRNATCIKDADVCAHRTPKTRAELIAMGYERSKVMALPMDANLNDSPVKIARTEPTDATSANHDDPIQKEQERVWYYEAYVRMDREDGKGTRLYKVCYGGGASEPFAIDEVDRAPFVAFVPLPVPHAFYGNNFAARVIPTQNARTVLIRAVLDHAARTTNPRWAVVKGGLVNPRELLDNRLGGIVNISRPDAVMPLMQPDLNPYVFSVMETLKTNKEESTGISALSQGLNKDAVSTQNSRGLVQDLVTLSQQRQKIIARNFAYGYLIPLYLEVYRLVLENERKEKIIEIAGNWVPVSVESWRARSECKVSLHLGYGERDRETAKYQAVYQALAADPAIAPMFGPEERYNLITDALKSAGLDNYARYLKAPDKVEPPQPDPMAMKELEIKEKTAEAALLNAQANLAKIQSDDTEKALRRELDAIKTQLDTLFKQNESDRLDLETATRAEVSLREVAVMEKQANEPKERTE